MFILRRPGQEETWLINVVHPDDERYAHLVDKYVDEYFGNLSEDLGGITDEDADKMIEVVEKFYIVMSNRK